MQLKRVTSFSPFPFPSQVPSSSFPRVTLELYELCREKEEQLCRVTEVQRLQAQQADAALEEFKRQVEVNSEKVYAEMKEQVRHTLILRNISLLTTWWGLETASEVKTHTAFTEDPSSVTTTHTGWLLTACNCSIKESNCLHKNWAYL